MKIESDFLRNNPVFWSRLGFCYDPPILNRNGSPLVFEEDFSDYEKYNKDFEKVGVKVFSSILHTGWVGIDKYDYSLTDRTLSSVLENCREDVFYIPRIKLNPPLDWCKANPEELFVYFGGPETAEEIKNLVGTLKQDILGYEAPNGYYVANKNAYKDNRPNVNGLISLQSFSSKKWLNDAGIALKKLLNHIENGKYADKIIGYHIAYGAQGETVLWGRASNRVGDYGIVNKKAFYNWGIKKYGSVKRLEKEWCQADINEKNIIIPSPDERAAKTADFVKFMRGDEKGQICIDYDIFTSETNANALLHFAEIAKSTGKLVGSFYGYFMHVDNAAYTGHLAIDRLLDSEYIDFLAAPKAYCRCEFGQPGGELCCAQSVNLKKLWIDELDNRTYLADRSTNSSVPNSPHQTISVMWREFAKNLSHNSGFWWMDLGGGWFDTPELMNEFKRLVRLNGEIRSSKYESVADMLIVVDEHSALYMRMNRDLRSGFMEDFIQETYMSGVICDIYRQCDLENIDLSRYKFIVFAYCVCLDYDEFARISERISDDTVVMFNYAVGVRGKNGFSLENTKKITGYTLKPTNSLGGFDFPQLCIKENGSNPNYIMNVKPYMRREEIRQTAKMAGCHIYSDNDGVTVFGSNAFLAVFNSAPNTVTLKLKHYGNYKDVFSGKTFDASKEIKIDMTKNNVCFLVKE